MEDLSLFTNTDFFDYDVFAKDAAEIVKSSGDSNESIDEFLKSISSLENDSILAAQEAEEEGLGWPAAQMPQEQQLITPQALALSSEDLQIPAVEEYKKRRTTAASARFRIKKKQKQQEMESQISKLHDDIAKYNNQIKKLEIENRLLKNLVFEKNNSAQTEASTTDFRAGRDTGFQYTL